MDEIKKNQQIFQQYFGNNHSGEMSIDTFFKDIAPEIGSIVLSFNSLDSLLNYNICELINERTDEPGAAVIYKQSFSNKVDLFNRLINLVQINCEEKILNSSQIIIDLRECAALRNAVIHAEWEEVDASGYTYVKLQHSKDGLIQEYWHFTKESLIKIDEFIHQTFLNLSKFQDDKNELLNKK